MNKDVIVVVVVTVRNLCFRIVSTVTIITIPSKSTGREWSCQYRFSKTLFQNGQSIMRMTTIRIVIYIHIIIIIQRWWMCTRKKATIQTLNFKVIFWIDNIIVLIISYATLLLQRIKVGVDIMVTRML